MESLPQTEPDSIHCLIVSQDNDVARKNLSSLPTLRIGGNNNKGDIERFATAWSVRIQEKIGLADDKTNDIAKSVTKTTGGKFLHSMHH
jgi:hypothetical protein